MKLKLNQLIFLTICILFTSCTIQKRMYRNGYHIEFKKRIGSPDNLKEETVNLETTVSSNKDGFDNEQISDNPNLENKSIEIVKSVNQIVEVSESTTITDKKISRNTPILRKQTIHQNKLQKENTKIKAKKKSLKPGEKQTGGLGIAGLVLLILGLLVFLFVSILIGVVIMVLGLTFIISNAVMKSKSKVPTDVVYLKNGSIIRGLIIEQIPNQTIKIRTKDGSIFVYKMEEVDKIVKEMP